MTKLSIVRKKAMGLGATALQQSTRKNKKFMVEYGGKKIHYGHSAYQDFLDHRDSKRRDSYKKRARGIKDNSGKLTYLNKNSANFWAYHTLW